MLVSGYLHSLAFIIISTDYHRSFALSITSIRFAHVKQGLEQPGDCRHCQQRLRPGRAGQGQRSSRRSATYRDVPCDSQVLGALNWIELD